MSSIAERLAEVRERLAGAARAAGRRPEDVRLVAVGKRHPVEALREAHGAGQRDFGENYAQELAEKALALRGESGVCFHAIGHVQSNKARLIAEHADLLHTVASASLAAAVARRREELGRPPLDVLVEVNLGGEAQKSGCAPGALSGVLDAVVALPALRLRGLMTIPPVTADPRDARRYFDALAALRDQHGGPRVLPELSMGMSDDFEEAIGAGATLVRIGTAIFGARPAPQP